MESSNHIVVSIAQAVDRCRHRMYNTYRMQIAGTVIHAIRIRCRIYSSYNKHAENILLVLSMQYALDVQCAQHVRDVLCAEYVHAVWCDTTPWTMFII